MSHRVTALPHPMFPMWFVAHSTLPWLCLPSFVQGKRIRCCPNCRHSRIFPMELCISLCASHTISYSVWLQSPSLPNSPLLSRSKCSRIHAYMARLWIPFRSLLINQVLRRGFSLWEFPSPPATNFSQQAIYSHNGCSVLYHFLSLCGVGVA